MAANAYHYIAAFPRVMEGPRPAWPVSVAARFAELADVVDVIFPDLTASWEREGDGEVRIESRRRFIEVYAKSATPAAARKCRDEIVRLIRELRDELEQPTTPVTLVTIPIEDAVTL